MCWFAVKFQFSQYKKRAPAFPDFPHTENSIPTTIDIAWQGARRLGQVNGLVRGTTIAVP